VLPPLKPSLHLPTSPTLGAAVLPTACLLMHHIAIAQTCYHISRDLPRPPTISHVHSRAQTSYRGAVASTGNAGGPAFQACRATRP
jgi:hypothetical protein